MHENNIKKANPSPHYIRPQERLWTMRSNEKQREKMGNQEKGKQLE